MSTQFAISCPHCAATLKLKNNKFVGKKVPCPKCKQPFVVEQPPEDEERVESLDDYGTDDTEDSELDEEVQAPRSRGKSKGDAKTGKGKRKKCKNGGGFASIAKIGGGAVLGLGLLGGIVYLAMSLFSGGNASDSWVKWLPEDSEVVVKVRVADSLSAPLFKPITDHPTLSKLLNQPPLPQNGGANPAAAFLQGLGVQPKDVDTVTVGMSDGLATVEANNQGQNRGPQRFVSVIRLKAPLDVSKLEKAPPTVLAKEDYKGKPLYSVVGAVNPKVSVYSIDSTTYLLGSDTELKAAVDGNGLAPASTRYSFADDSANFVFVAAPKNPDQLKSLGLSMVKKFGSGKAETSNQIQGIHGVSYTVVLGQDLVFNTRTSLDPGLAQSTADQIKLEIDQAREQFKTATLQMKGANPFVSQEQLDKLTGHVDAMLGGAQASANGSLANVTLTLSGQIVTDALQIASPFMPMLEQMAKQQVQPGALPLEEELKPKIGDKAIDVLEYPGMVIKAGEKSKAKLHNLADKHNAELEAAMQEGNPAFAAPSTDDEPPELPAKAVGKKKAKEEEPEEEGTSAAKEEASEEKSVAMDKSEEESEEEEEEAIPENDDDIPEGLAGIGMRLERQKAREAAAAKKAGKTAKKTKSEDEMPADEETDSDSEEMKNEPDSDADPDAVPADQPAPRKRSKKNKGDEDEDSGAMKPEPAASTTPAAGSPPVKRGKKKSKDDEDEGDAAETVEPVDGASMGLRLGGDPDAAPVMKSKKGDDEAEPAEDGEEGATSSKSRSRRRSTKKKSED